MEYLCGEREDEQRIAKALEQGERSGLEMLYGPIKNRQAEFDSLNVYKPLKPKYDQAKRDREYLGNKFKEL